LTVHNTPEEEIREYLMLKLHLLSMVPHYFQPGWEIQQVCNHSTEIAELRKQITILQPQMQPVQLGCDHTILHTEIQNCRSEVKFTRCTSRMVESGDNILQISNDMPRDIQQSVKITTYFSSQVVTAIRLASQAALKAL
jgi:hypothetical protein